MEAEIRVRDAGPEDVETIARFNASMARETEGLELALDLARRGARRVIEDPACGRYLIAEREGEAAGQLLITYEWSDWRNAVFFWIQSVYTAPRHRRRGVFRALWSRVLELAREQSACGVRLYVHESNRTAREVYARLGLVAPGYVVLETPDALREGGAERPPGG